MIEPRTEVHEPVAMFSDPSEKDLYVQGVWEVVESKYLRVYSFLTDAEFRDLFGGKVLNAIAMLDCPQQNCGLCDIDIDLFQEVGSVRHRTLQTGTLPAVALRNL